MKTYRDYLEDRMMAAQGQWAELEELTYRSLGADNWYEIKREADGAWLTFLDRQQEFNNHVLSTRRSTPHA